jgi:hypothetical protein
VTSGTSFVATTAIGAISTSAGATATSAFMLLVRVKLGSVNSFNVLAK